MKYAKEAHKPGSDHESPRSTQCLHLLLLRPRRCSPSVYWLGLFYMFIGSLLHLFYIYIESLLHRPRRCSPSVYLLLLLLFRVGGGTSKPGRWRCHSGSEVRGRSGALAPVNSSGAGEGSHGLAPATPRSAVAPAKKKIKNIIKK